MKTATRSRAGPRRGLALLATALLLTATIATPALGEPGSPAADPCQVGETYTDKHDVSPDNAVNVADIVFDGDVIGTLTANDPLGTVTIALEEGYEDYTIDLCVFGGKERQEYTGVGDGFVSDPLSTPSEQDTIAGVSNFAWRVIPPVVPDTYDVELVKAWEVTNGPADLFDEDDASATLTATPATGLEDGDTFTVTETDIDTGTEQCTVTDTAGLGDQTLDADQTVDGTYTHTVTNYLTCDADDDEPELIAVGLYKLWLDAEGDVIQEDVPEVDFTLTLSVDEEVLATLDQDSELPWVWVDLEPDTTYTVAESGLADGWETVTCPEFDEGAGAGDHSGVGTFELTDGGRHFVCNQLESEPETLPVVITRPEEQEPEVAPEVAEQVLAEEAEVEVLAKVQERTLPRTGADTAALALLAAGMLMLGAATLASTTPAPARRRRQ